jgi:hypothetical protein
MKDRRLQIGSISMHIVASWGKGLGDKIKEFLPDDAIVLKQQENFDRACMDLLVHHESFTDVSDGHKIPRTVLPIPLKAQEDKPKLIYDH